MKESSWVAVVSLLGVRRGVTGDLEGVLVVGVADLPGVAGLEGWLPGTRPPDASLAAFLLGLGDST